MTKKLFIGTFLLGGILFLSTNLALADEEIKPWHLFSKFRGEEKLSAQEMEILKDDFYVYRNKAREEHRKERMLQREERLQAAIERGCITEEEAEIRMQKRGNRFSK